MKKQYEKPLIAIEHYELTQSIASCGVKFNFLDKFCVIKDSDATTEMRNLAMKGYFIECTNVPSYGEDNADSICYHTNTNVAFNS